MRAVGRRLGAVSLSAAALAALAVVAAPEASAWAAGCTGSDGASYNCVKVEGSGMYVKSVRIGRFHPTDNVCVDKVRMYVVTRNGSYAEAVREAPLGGCHRFEHYADIRVERSYEPGSRICGLLYDREGKLYDGSPCETVAPDTDEVAPGDGPPSNGTPT